MLTESLTGPWGKRCWTEFNIMARRTTAAEGLLSLPAQMKHERASLQPLWRRNGEDQHCPLPQLPIRAQQCEVEAATWRITWA